MWFDFLKTEVMKSHSRTVLKNKLMQQAYSSQNMQVLMWSVVQKKKSHRF
jgi:hypothetical protein